MREKIPDPCDARTFLASKLDWHVIDQAQASRDFRALTQELLRIRQDKIVPLIKQGVVAAQADMIGADDAIGGLDMRWRTGKGDVLQIVANFSDGDSPIPTLIDGEILWASQGVSPDMLPPAYIIVRLHSGANSV
jgi:maltooligosyltrehalose trehalohydrolase